MRYHSPSSFVVAAVIALLASHASADIIGVSGAATLIPRPPDATAGAIESNTTAFVWNEAQGVTLAAPITIDASAPGLYDSALAFEFSTLPAGSIVSSHMIHFDTVGSQLHWVNGSVTLDADIIGVIAWNRPGQRHLGESDAPLGLDTLYEFDRDRRGVFDNGDGTIPGDEMFIISPDRRTLTFNLGVNFPYDQIRIVTTAVPEPGSLALLSLMGFAGLRRRREARR
ncbi:MAG: hypothetical protein BroJett005_29980 [Ignavibacteriota bacterium]|nr:MAG: hypothetical protein BroJett005_29980 [Ignavibacteriota bacterium]